MKIKQSKVDVGVIVGRFQVHDLHEGHLQLIKGVVEDHHKVILVLGLSPFRGTINNPLDFESRKQMILEHFPDVNVLYIKDIESDKIWSEKLDALIGDLIGPRSTVMLYGGRECFIDHYHGKYPTCEIEQEVYISGTQIRQEISQTAKADSRFRAGVIWQAYNQYPRIIPTVDVAVWNEDGTKLLMARKPHEKLYRFIGGFAEGPTYERDAHREVAEEAQIEIAELRYVGSTQIDDWRLRREQDKIVTTLFEAKYVFGKPTASDDIEELRWFAFDKLRREDLVDEHWPLLDMLVNAKKKNDAIAREENQGG